MGDQSCRLQTRDGLGAEFNGWRVGLFSAGLRFRSASSASYAARRASRAPRMHSRTRRLRSFPTAMTASAISTIVQPVRTKAIRIVLNKRISSGLATRLRNSWKLPGSNLPSSQPGWARLASDPVAHVLSRFFRITHCHHPCRPTCVPADSSFSLPPGAHLAEIHRLPRTPHTTPLIRARTCQRSANRSGQKDVFC